MYSLVLLSDFQTVSIETLLDVFILLYRECEVNVKNEKNMEIFVQNSKFEALLCSVWPLVAIKQLIVKFATVYHVQAALVFTC